ncbi:MAG: tetratricopeptide repeat protein [Phycisphaerales bacterium]
MESRPTELRIYLAHGPYLDAERRVIAREVGEWNQSGAGAVVRLLPEDVDGAESEVSPADADAFLLLLADRWRSKLALSGAARDPEAEYEAARAEFDAAINGERRVRLAHLGVFLRDAAGQVIATMQENQVAVFRKAVRDDAHVTYREFLTLESLAGEFRAWLESIARAGGPVGDAKADDGIQDSDDPLKEALALANAGLLARAEAAFTLAVAKANNTRAFIEYGKYLRRRGRVADSCGMFDRAVARARAVGDLSREAEAVSNLGLAYRALGRLEDARRLHAEALELARRAGDQVAHADSLAGLSRLRKGDGDLRGAFRLAKQSLRISHNAGDMPGYAAQCANIGLLYRRRGQLSEAEKWLRRAMTLDERQGREEAVARNCGNLALVHRARGELDTAERLLARAAEINAKLGCLAGLANDYANLGQVCSDRGDPALAQKYHEASREIEERIDRPEGLARSHHSLGLLAHDRRDAEEARKHWTLAAELFERAGLISEAGRCRSMIEAARAGLDPVLESRDFRSMR